MEIDKNQIRELLRERGQTDEAEQADRELPQQGDTDGHGHLLLQVGLRHPTILSKVGGGHGGRGGLSGLLGG